ncbi:hypothetical protein [Chryseobacterium potabilaquae]|uniref:Uncharacterized protein n=1 Tax=Chryseobacterium potabilaquae TaxID=2675057 RepID=A0A6N4X750_9FLAO|nr:hypothetical protein [Chryseobacterium potabilaquae]CAA7196809.1 hypothetical protein CHRY9293_02880 [Chryseobacterium potabilaquae]
MENILIILSCIGFCRAFYYAIGEPMSAMNENAILYCYTDCVSRLIARIHHIPLPGDGTIAYYVVLGYVERYYKFLGFCYICFSFWVGMIFCGFYFNSLHDKAAYFGLFILINFIIRKWTI